MTKKYEIPTDYEIVKDWDHNCWAVMFRGHRLANRPSFFDGFAAAMEHLERRKLKSFQNLDLENGSWI